MTVRLGAEQRRALELLAGSHGVNAELLVHGHYFSRRVLAGLIHAGLAAVERKVTAGKAIEVVRIIRITAAGRKAIGDGQLLSHSVGGDPEPPHEHNNH